MIIKKLKKGDYVRHIIPTINGNFPMTIEQIDESELNGRCSHLIGVDQKHQTDWFPLSDLIFLN